MAEYNPLNFSTNFVNKALNPQAPVPYNPGNFSNTFVQNATGSPVLDVGTGGLTQNTGNNNSSPASNPPTTNLATNAPQTSNYDQLVSQLNSMTDSSISALDPQKSNQEAIVSNSYNQGLSDLNSQLDTGSAQLDTSKRKAGENQAKTLNDLTSNIKNQIMAGQVFLGAHGAADSSASNQYSYALTKMGNQNRSNVQSQTNSIYADIEDRRNQLVNSVEQGKQQLLTQKTNALLGISTWYQQAVAQIKQTRDSNIFQLSQQALANATNALNQVNQNYQAQYNSLLSWAEARSADVVSLQKNLQGVLNASYMLPQAAPVNGTIAQANQSTGGYFPGQNSTLKYDFLGNPIS